MLHFKRVYKLLEEYGKSQDKEGNEDTQVISRSLGSSPKKQSHALIPPSSSIFITQQGKNKCYDSLDKTVALQ